MDAQAQEALNRAQEYSNQANKLATEAKALSDQVKAEAEAALERQYQSVSGVDLANAQAAFEQYNKALMEAEASARTGEQLQDVTFNQYNTSPEAISASDAYRNGLSLVSIIERKLVPTS